MAILNSEPELAVCRSCGVLSNFAPDGSTPLHCAARAGNIDVVKYLLSLKKPQSNENLVNVWARDLQGRVALHLAAEYEHVELCKVLMSAMTEPNEITRDPPSTPRSVVGSSAPVDLTGTTPLGWASRRRKGRPSSPIRELLFKEGDSSILPQKFYLERSGKTPRKRTQSKSHPSKNLSSDEIIFAHSEAQGWRPEMEDATLCQCPLLSNQSQTYWLFGVFDGHGGDFSSKFASSKLPSILVPFLHQLEYPLESDLKRILYDSCISLDAALSEEERMKVTAKQGTLDGTIRLNISDTSGTTACVLLITIDYLLLANIGDSRAVMARASSDDSPLAIPLSIDQKLSIEEERSRALRAGCTYESCHDLSHLSH